VANFSYRATLAANSTAELAEFAPGEHLADGPHLKPASMPPGENLAGI